MMNNMSSSTSSNSSNSNNSTVASSRNLTMNNNDRKRPLSSSVRPSPPPPTKRRGPSSTSRKVSCPPSHMLSNSGLRRSERTETTDYTKSHGRSSSTGKKTNGNSERPSRSKQQHERMTRNKSSSSESSRSSSTSDRSSKVMNDIMAQHLLSEESGEAALTRSTMLRPLTDSHKQQQQQQQTINNNGNNGIKQESSMIKRDNIPNENTSAKKTAHHSNNIGNKKTDLLSNSTMTKKGESVSLIVKSSMDKHISIRAERPSAASIDSMKNKIIIDNDQRNNHRSMPSLLVDCDSDEEIQRHRHMLHHLVAKSTPVIVPSTMMAIVTTPDIPKKHMRTDNVIIQQFDGKVNGSVSATKLVKLVVPPTAASSSIKMLSSGDGLASALRVPTKIQLTKPLLGSSFSNDKISSSSSISTLTGNLDQSVNQRETPSSPTTPIEIPVDLTLKQSQSIVDYPSSSLPPTPPPPVIDVRNHNVHTSNKLDEQKQNHHYRDNKTSAGESTGMETDPSNVNEDHANVNQLHSSNVNNPSSSDWFVPPTSELSPTSLTSSSPDMILAQNHLHTDDSLVELDIPTTDFSSNQFDSSLIKRRYRSLSSSSPIQPSSISICDPATSEPVTPPYKSKSLTRLSNSSSLQLMFLNKNHNSVPSTTISSSQRMRKKRREIRHTTNPSRHGRIVKLKAKTSSMLTDYQFKSSSSDFDETKVIQTILNEMVDRIVVVNDHRDNALKTLLITPVPRLMPKQMSEVFDSTTLDMKQFDGNSIEESRPMIMTSGELDELASLLYANVHRGEFERIGNANKVEERMREMWSQMSSQKKNGYYKRVIQIYKRPNREVVIASSSTSTGETHASIDIPAITPTTPATINPLLVELQRQTSTPLSFHSVASSSTDEPSTASPLPSASKTMIFADIVNELIKGAKGLDKLSCTPVAFSNSIHNFVRSTVDKQTQIVRNLERQVEKKCSMQLNRATVFWTQKIHYFAGKHSIIASSECMNEMGLIVKYFYLLVLSLNCKKQEADFEAALTDLLNGKLIFNESFHSSILTSVLEDLVLRSSLANDFLGSQPIVIGQIEHTLPLVRNIDLENEILLSMSKNETWPLTSNPFVDLIDLEDYLTHCERITSITPCYAVQQSHHPAMYYSTYHHHQSTPIQYYYSPTQQPPPDMSSYYYNPNTSYSNSQQSYGYSHASSSYYNPHLPPSTYATTTYDNNEQLKYYYNQQATSQMCTYAQQSNSTNDIPLANTASLHSVHRTFRRPPNANMHRKYSASQQPSTPGAPGTPGTPSTPAVFDATNTGSPQSITTTVMMNTTSSSSYPS